MDKDIRAYKTPRDVHFWNHTQGMLSHSEGREREKNGRERAISAPAPSAARIKPKQINLLETQKKKIITMPQGRKSTSPPSSLSLLSWSSVKCSLPALLVWFFLAVTVLAAALGGRQRHQHLLLSSKTTLNLATAVAATAFPLAVSRARARAMEAVQGLGPELPPTVIPGRAADEVEIHRATPRSLLFSPITDLFGLVAQQKNVMYQRGTVAEQREFLGSAEEGGGGGVGGVGGGGGGGARSLQLTESLSARAK